MDVGIGFIAGFVASIFAGALVISFFAYVQRPDLAIVDEPYYHDLTYRVIKLPQGTEVRATDGFPPPQGSYTRDLSYYNVSVSNLVHTKCPFSLFVRNTAWGTVAHVGFAPFLPGGYGQGSRASAFGFFGRWGATPEPVTPAGVEQGRYVDILPRRKMVLNLAQKYDGDDSAWGFTNESYLFFAEERGLWRHPDFELPLHTHWRVSIELETTRRFKPEYFHAHVRDNTRHGLDLHRWGGCGDCQGRDAASV